jgi:hypothetical protein
VNLARRIQDLDPRFLLALGLLLLLGLIFPGDVQFIKDEGLLITNAVAANGRGELATRGLIGTAGIYYGPIPTWFYQAALCITRDLILISLVKNGVSLLLLVLGLAWLGRLCRLPLVWMLPVFMAPFFWQINRSLWDDGFCHIIGLICLASYLQFVKTGSLRGLIGAALLAVLLVHIQIKSVFVVLAVFASFVLLDHKRWRDRPIAHFAAPLLGIAACLPYGLYVLQNMRPGGSGGAAATLLDRLQFAGSSLLAHETIAWQGWSTFILPEIYGAIPGPLLPILGWLSSLALLVMIVGFIVELRGLRIHELRGRAALLCLAVILQFAAFFALTGRKFLPHYHLAVWFAFFYFFWAGAQAMWRARLGKALLLTYALAQFALFGISIGFIHSNGGNRSHRYGPTLASQLQVARQVAALPAGSPVGTEVQNIGAYRHSFEILLYLVGGEREDGPPRPSIIGYREQGGNSGWIELRSAP